MVTAITKPHPNILVRLKTGEKPGTRLFCFPFAGGGVSFYRRWADLIPPSLELWGIQLPGREERFKEQAATDPEPILARIVQELQALPELPFVFFGHSMGALMAFAAAHLLTHGGAKPPVHLFISGREAPNLCRTIGLSSRHSNTVLIEKVAQLGAMPGWALEDPELMDLLLPILRADLSLLEKLQQMPWTPLPIPFTVFGGRSDGLARVPGLLGWSAYTSAGMGMNLYEGSHFYLAERKEDVLARIIDRIRGPH